mmetsp:Transcript_68987/g.121790  ORF Transcript_68987/g.121790 Transcript_68987/m.121790 type:complete len:209 (-) Transcript_68987:135-761(-)
MPTHSPCACFLPDSVYQNMVDMKQQELRLPVNALDADPTCISQSCQLSDLKPIESRGHRCPGIHSCIASIENSGTINANSVSLSCSNHYRTGETKKNDNTPDVTNGTQKVFALIFILIFLLVLVLCFLWVFFFKKKRDRKKMASKKRSKRKNSRNTVKRNLLQELNGMLTGRISTLKKPNRPRKTKRRSKKRNSKLKRSEKRKRDTGG